MPFEYQLSAITADIYQKNECSNRKPLAASRGLRTSTITAVVRLRIDYPFDFIRSEHVLKHCDRCRQSIARFLLNEINNLDYLIATRFHVAILATGVISFSLSTDRICILASEAISFF